MRNAMMVTVPALALPAALLSLVAEPGAALAFTAALVSAGAVLGMLLFLGAWALRSGPV